jgi:hypothetical protein
MPFLLGLLKPYALKLLAGLAIVGAVLAILLGAKNAGRAAERVDGMRRQLDNVKERTDVENDVARADPVERSRLRRKWERD